MSPDLSDAGLLTADQWLGDVAAIADLADKAVRVVPQAQRSALARVLKAVREHLVHREHEVLRAIAEPGLLRMPPHEPSCGAQRGKRYAELLSLGGRCVQRSREARGDRVDPAVVIRDLLPAL